MRNKRSIFLLFLFLVCLAHTTRAAFPLRHVHGASDNLLIAGEPGPPGQEKVTDKASFLQQQIAWPDYGKGAGHRAGNRTDAQRALSWALIGILVLPLGALAMHFAMRSWKKGERMQGLAIAAFVLGVMEVCLCLFILSVALIAG